MDNILLEIGGKELYFDIDELSSAVQVEQEFMVNLDSKGDINYKESLELDEKLPDGIKIDVTKYEMYRDLINTLLSTNDMVDDKMGIMGLNSLPLPFKLSYNTLILKGILKEL
tara:strand:+ start:674 stop:1012 length:339 start_codon:yes stop_codon:yes gene_type:complete